MKELMVEYDHAQGGWRGITVDQKLLPDMIVQFDSLGLPSWVASWPSDQIFMGAI
ncbi:hypothetical protein QC823_02315 [Halomonas vilamensis]|uniref:Uncharacterized protein n=1 Tax=Vreelandella vilamensis TaxID=531309 RepID=A0ABU1H0J2_9GAMM|nr:hypothetical protein [Halomonas vilamensis]MDR5897832.1 hypothetical protein [Halomonas vilamensis]